MGSVGRVGRVGRVGSVGSVMKCGGGYSTSNLKIKVFFKLTRLKPLEGAQVFGSRWKSVWE